MDTQHNNGALADHGAVGPLGETLEPGLAPKRCSICQRRLGKTIHFLEETGDVPAPRQAWALCDTCNAAVRAQVESSVLRTPVKLRVAVGLVAAERTPAARRANYGQMSDLHWERILFWSFLLFMLAHLALIVFIASIAR
ncbi:MAG TPA: hypothetical protein VKQ36_15585 [Ktedonobacterales bacterium]|nr:hypothetical protein [Ktedonobacterales bacterium]